MNRVLGTLIGGAIGLWLLSYTAFIVDQRRFAIVSSMGETRQIVDEPGLHFKLPPFQTVTYVDKRIMTLETPDTDRYSTAEINNQRTDLLVSALVKWQIGDVKLNFVTNGADDAHNHDRLTQVLKSALSDEIAKHSPHDVVSAERNHITDAVRLRLADAGRQMGIDILDLHLKRVDYLDQASSAIYDRMKADQLSVASALRNTGNASAEATRAEADNKSQAILGDAKLYVETTRGDGDATAADIAAKAYSQYPEFYKFSRSLEAYRASFKSRSDVMIVDPNSEFFKYMKNPEALGAKK